VRGGGSASRGQRAVSAYDACTGCVGQKNYRAGLAARVPKVQRREDREEEEASETSDSEAVGEPGWAVQYNEDQSSEVRQGRIRIEGQGCSQGRRGTERAAGKAKRGPSSSISTPNFFYFYFYF